MTFDDRWLHILIQKEDTLKFRQDLFQPSAILTSPRLAVAVLASTATIALASCGGGGSLNSTAAPPQTDPETPHKVDDIPLGHKLAEWLTNNRERTVNVRAGEFFDAGGVRFTCPSEGEDCSLKVTLVENSINVTSSGGMATADSVPPPTITTKSGGTPTTQQSRQTIPRRNGLFDMSGLFHGLNTARLPVPENGRRVNKLLAKNKASVFSIDDGETKDYGRVRFSCRGAGCEVQIINTDKRGFNVTYRGNVSATLIFNPTKMRQFIWSRQEYCLNDSIGDCSLNPRGAANIDYRSRYPAARRNLGSDNTTGIRSKEIELELIGFNPYILTEVRNAQIASNYGWQGKQYNISSDGNPNDEKNAGAELVIYTNADGSEDTDYLSYGRSMLISGRTRHWFVDGLFAKSKGSTYGLGDDLTEKVTYSGGATGWYTFSGAEDAGYFTARAKLKADLGDALDISGTIDRFVDQEGRSRNWKVDLESNKLNSRGRPTIDPLQSDTLTKTTWTIGDTSGDKDRSWQVGIAETGNSLHGSFQATFNKDGKNGRLNGAFGAEKR